MEQDQGMLGGVELVWLGHIDCADAYDLLRRAGAQLEMAGLVQPGYGEALVTREESYPTGLKLTAGGVAIHHADVEYARRAAIAVALPDKPVTFRAMDFSAEPIEVRAVMILVLTDREQQVPWLARLVERMQEPEWLDHIVASNSADDLAALI